MADQAEGNRASAYDAWYDSALGGAAHRIELSMVAALAAPVPPKRALDVGCGTGIYTGWLAELGLEVIGVDVDAEMLAAARSKVARAAFVQADATKLPFADGTFDLALGVTIFCFLDEHQRRLVAHELVRVVRPGGRIVVGELARYSPWAAKRRIDGWRGSVTWRSAHFTTARELRRTFRDAGAISTASRYGVYLPPWDVQALVARSDAIERIGRPLRALGAAFVVVRAEVG